MEEPSPPPLFTTAALRTLGVLTLFALALTLWYCWGKTQLATRPLSLHSKIVPFDLNRSDEHQLAAVPGLGPTLARRIVAYREQHGPFQSVDELDKIYGIGPATLERLRPFLCVESSEMMEKVIRAQNTEVRSPAKPLTESPIDPNHATMEQLQSLPGIGPVLAERIHTEARQRPFRSVEELRRVKGIGTKTLEKLRPHIQIQP
jgi:competence protein ComEA